MDLNPDLIELLKRFSASKVRFLIVGAHAVAFHGHPRFTGDLDLWVDPSPENAERVWTALQAFGAPLSQLTPATFTEPHNVFQMGIAPHRFDILTGIEGVGFAAAWKNRARGVLADVAVYYLGRQELVKNKKAVGRPQDLLDVTNLEAYKKHVRRKRRGT